MTPRVDVVVVGAGSAGAVVAARLAEHPRRSVLLLEAGPDHTSATTPPAVSGTDFLLAVREPGMVHSGLSAVRAAGQAARPYLRGRGVGGSSAVNAMVLLPGEPDDFDEWEAMGARGWAWRDLAPWFSRVAVKGMPVASHGAVASAVLASTASAEPARLALTSGGRRVSASDAYLEPMRSASNLVVHGDALVDRVLFDGRRAVGVRLADGSEIEAGAVVLSGGAIHSPALLLRSRVDTVGVGEGLQDHPSFPVTLRLRHPNSASPVVTALVRDSYLDTHDLQVLAMERADPDMPDLAVLLGAYMRPRSRGSVRLVSDDPTVHPEVDFAMLSDDRDVAGLRAAVRLVERIASSPEVTAVAEVLPYDASATGIRAGLGDYVHAAGGCALGAVLEPDCSVRGYEHLWVCDASVFPAVPRANTHLPVMAVAEKAAAHLSGVVPASL